MDHLLATLLEEFAEQLPDTEDSVERSFSFPQAPKMINVAIGMRRSGKTYFLYQKIRELLDEGVDLQQILFVNFEDERILPMNQKELGALLDSFYTLYPENHDRQCYFFLDEIQNVENWPLVIRRFYDKKKVKLFLSGSSAKLLSKEIATSLRGRSISTEVWPFSFEEYCHAHEIKKPKRPIGKKALDTFHRYFSEYLTFGGFPAIQYLYETEQRTVLKNYIDTVVFRDIIERHKIKNTSLVKYLIKTLIKNVSSSFSVNKFYNDIKSQGIKVGKDTLYQYLDYIEDTYLIFGVSLFTESIRKMQSNPKKIYAIDSGLVYANRLDLSHNYGCLFENLIFLDLRRKGAKIHYYRTKEGFEVDFLAEYQNSSRELIQVVWDLSDPATLEREERALKIAKKELGLKGRILTPENYLRDFLKNYNL